MNELIVFARAPRLGQVKSRLAAAIGNERALEAYQILLRELARKLSGSQRLIVQFAPIDGEKELRTFFPLAEFRPQVGSDLGDRLRHAFTESFRLGASKTAIIGSDCPYLEMDDIQCAWEWLGEADAVFGPALDGGYWLVGLKSEQPGLFHAVSWGTAEVLRQSLTRAESLGISVRLLRRLSDIDTAKDWTEFCRLNAQLIQSQACDPLRRFPD